MLYKLNQRVKLLSPKKGHYICKEIIEDPDISLSFEHVVGKCKDCGGEYIITKDFDLTEVYVFENEETGELIIKGGQLRDDGRHKFIRMPDDDFFPEKKADFINKVKNKSKILGG